MGGIVVVMVLAFVIIVEATANGIRKSQNRFSSLEASKRYSFVSPITT